MKLSIFDIETDGLNPTLIHCLSHAEKEGDEWTVSTITDYDEMREYFDTYKAVAGHYITKYDIPAVEDILDIKVTSTLVDTLALSWTLYPERESHRLELWGENFGIKKPVIDDWENQTLEEYIHRCEEDVKINCQLWDKQVKDLSYIYDDMASAWDFIKYLSFKMLCTEEAENNPFVLDVERCESSLVEMEKSKDEKVVNLALAMPKVEVITTAKKPNSLIKKDGKMSVAGIKWCKILRDNNLAMIYTKDVEYISGYDEPNPNSPKQIKDWLFGLGWKPKTFSYVKKIDDNGRDYMDAIPQVRKDIKGEKVLCDSVKKLFNKEPALEELEGLSILTHRIAILKGYLKEVGEDGTLKSEIHGLTNTLRLRHRTIVNLPSVNKPYGDIVRGVLLPPEGYELCGSDMSSLEDRTKQHYMWDYDPEYVKEMITPDFDPHLALAEFAGALSSEQVVAHKEGKEDHSVARHQYKTGNYSCTYGAGGKALARTLDISVEEGTKIVTAYRDRNWSVDEIAKNVVTKKVYGQMWLFNPVSKFWYSLRHDKDKFSTLNQGTGVYIFDMWIAYVRKAGLKISFQYHDEIVLFNKIEDRDKVEGILKDAITKVNKKLKLNRDMDISIQFGKSYANIH